MTSEDDISGTDFALAVIAVRLAGILATSLILQAISPPRGLPPSAIPLAALDAGSPLQPPERSPRVTIRDLALHD